MPAVPFFLADALAFAHPERLWLLLALPVLAGLFFWAERRSARRLAGLASPRLRVQLLRGASPGRRRARFGLMLGALGCFLVALARPQWGFDRQEIKRRGLDIILAFDVSKSMLANDLEPTRLTRAKLAAQDLLALCQGDRVGLVAFAGRAFLMAPLTIDHGAVLNSLAELDTEIIPRGGTNLAEAIDLSLEAFGKGEGSDRAIVFLTDGEELEADVMAKIRTAREAGVRIFCVGVGSAEGSLIPLPGGGFVRDRSGQMVRSRLDEERLRQVASAGGGIYVRLGSGPRVIDDLWRDGLAKLQAGEKETQTTLRAVDRFQWPIGAGVLLLAAGLLISERRRERAPAPSAVVPKPAPRAAAVASVLFVAFVLSRPIQAASAARDGIRQYNDGRFPDATRTFDELARQHPNSARYQFNLGASAYKAGEYGRAVEAFGRVLGAEDPTLLPQAYYNLGNSLFRQGEKQKEPAARIRDWENALGHYDSALRLNPENADAKANRALVARALEEEKKKQPPPPSKDSSPDAQQPDQNDGQPPQDQQNPSDPKSGKDGQKPPPKDGQQDSPPKDEKQDKKEGSSGEGQDQNEGNPEDQPPQSGDQKEGGEKEGQEKKPSNSSRPDNKSGGQGNKDQPPPQMGEGPQGDVQAREPQTAEGKEAKEQPGKQGTRPEGETKDGRLSAKQARDLLDALKGEDDRVLFNDRNKRQEPVYKDW